VIARLDSGSPAARVRLALAHGAGAPMDSPFMAAMAEGLAARGVRVVRFEFPYMAARRQGRRPGPDPLPKLLQSWRDLLVDLGGAEGWAIGGKSLGGRAASLVADEVGARALVCLGYPFHPPGRPEKTAARVPHLAELRTPTLIVQGTRDPFGSPADVAGYRLSAAIRMHWIEGGDHSLKDVQAAVEATAAFLEGLAS
jgi:predicted alpha/beta-hydrolase family hydrolase